MSTPDATAGSPGAAGSAEQRWRQLTRPLWRKHHRAGRYMMRWLYVPGRKPRLRHKKWARQYERTLDRIPMPPEDDPPNAAVSDGGTPFAPRPGSARYCDDPDNCTYSDCPTAFCDRNFANGTESQRPGAAGAQMQTCVRDVGIRHDLKSPNSELNDSKSQYPVANTPPKAEESQSAS